MPTSDLSPALARGVRAETLEPRQRRASRGLRTRADFRLQHMCKHDRASEFHSRAEQLHAALLEADPMVIRYVPQPFALRVGTRLYTPDCYVLGERERRRVVEIKPEAAMEEALRVSVAAFLAEHRIDFEVLSTEAIYAREIEAENWVEIVRILYRGRDFTTTEAEFALAERIFAARALTLGDVVDLGDRERTYLDELALFRLLHRGRVRAELAERPLGLDTVFGPCT